MNGALDIKYVKASEVKVSDIDSASLVYFSKYTNNDILQMYKQKTKGSYLDR